MSKLAELRARLKSKIEQSEAAPDVAPMPESPKLVAVPMPEQPKPKIEIKAEQVFNREAWLTVMAESLVRQFDIFSDLPKYKISVGFPRGARGSNKLVGQTIPASKTDDGIAQIFVTPIAGTDEEAVLVLMSQLCELKAAQSGLTLSAALESAGLVRTGDKLKPIAFENHKDMQGIIEAITMAIGNYPHAAVKRDYERQRDSAGIKIFCEKTGYKARIAQSWLDKLGSPKCPCCDVSMKAEVKQ